MKKIVLTIVLILTTSIHINSQEIEMKKVLGGYVFKQEGKKLSLKQMQEVMKNNKEAFDLVQSAKSNQTWGMVLGAAGGALVGFPIGTSLGGGEPKWALAGVGAALIVATIPIINKFNKKTSKAVTIYNDGISSTSYRFQPSINLNVKGTGIGLTMSF
jgi:uncharacterized protein YcfJ